MQIPKEIEKVLSKLEKSGFEAYIVGGCVRDILRDEIPKDWDITTSAKPVEIQKIFPKSVYENKFGTVAIKTSSKDETLKIVEVTTFRLEAKYSDKRHPDSVNFTDSLEEDLKRRDFTINAMALQVQSSKFKIQSKELQATNYPASISESKADKLQPTLIDPFNGLKDLKQGVIRTVGNPKERFGEDALRLMRAVRFAASLNFTIEGETFYALKSNSKLIQKVANERIRDELMKIIDTKNAHKGILFMKDSGLLELVLPEIAKGVGVEQNKHHKYTVFEHNLYALKWAEEHDYPLHVKFAALFHDVGKPQTKRGKGVNSTFYGHEVVGGRITQKIFDRLKFPKEFTTKVVRLVRFHLFYYEVGEVTDSSIRRLVAKVGPENMKDLVMVRICDRMGSGVPKPEPYRLRHFQYMVEKVQKDPISVGMLKVSGNDVIKILKIKPGPKIGQILAILLEEVLDDPAKNEKKHQLEYIKKLGKRSDKELEKFKKKSLKKQEKAEKIAQKEIQKKYYVE